MVGQIGQDVKETQRTAMHYILNDNGIVRHAYCDGAAEAPAMAIPLCDAVSWAQKKHGASLDHDVTPGEGDAWRINSKGAYSYTLGEAEDGQGARMLLSLLDQQASCSKELAWALKFDEKKK